MDFCMIWKNYYYWSFEKWKFGRYPNSKFIHEPTTYNYYFLRLPIINSSPSVIFAREFFCNQSLEISLSMLPGDAARYSWYPSSSPVCEGSLNVSTRNISASDIFPHRIFRALQTDIYTKCKCLLFKVLPPSTISIHALPTLFPWWNFPMETDTYGLEESKYM